MPVLTGPIFSLQARGSLAKTLIFNDRKGVAVARQMVTGAQPRTPAQQNHRALFAWLSNLWAGNSVSFQDNFSEEITPTNLPPRNKYMQLNLPLLKGQTTISRLSVSPGNGGAPLPISLTITPGLGSLTWTLKIPASSPGWTYIAGTVYFIRQQNPLTDSDFVLGNSVDFGNPASNTITGLVAGADYVCMGEIFWLKSTGLNFDSMCINAIGTPT